MKSVSSIESSYLGVVNRITKKCSPFADVLCIYVTPELDSISAKLTINDKSKANIILQSEIIKVATHKTQHDTRLLATTRCPVSLCVHHRLFSLYIDFYTAFYIECEHSHEMPCYLCITPALFRVIALP